MDIRLMKFSIDEMQFYVKAGFVTGSDKSCQKSEARLFKKVTA